MSGRPMNKPIFLAAMMLVTCFSTAAMARDPDGSHADDPLHKWFDSLASGKGLCCSFADGVSIEGVDWDTGGPDGGYRVRLKGEWIDVPSNAVVQESNRYVLPSCGRIKILRARSKSGVFCRALGREAWPGP
jgi:hypothetical protein